MCVCVCVRACVCVCVIRTHNCPLQHKCSRFAYKTSFPTANFVSTAIGYTVLHSRTREHSKPQHSAHKLLTPLRQWFPPEIAKQSLSEKPHQLSIKLRNRQFRMVVQMVTCKWLMANGMTSHCYCPEWRA